MRTNHVVGLAIAGLLVFFLQVKLVPHAAMAQDIDRSAGEVAANGIGAVQTVTIFVNFQTPREIDEELYIPGIFGAENSISSYLKEISYERLWLESTRTFHVTVDSPVTHYSWGYLPSEFETGKAKELSLHVIDTVMALNHTFDFQNQLVIFVLNVTTEDMKGRGAMGLVPGVSPLPKRILPENQELFVGPFMQGDTEVLKACFIDTTFPFISNTADDYRDQRWTQFQNGDDRFIRGLAIFCNDAVLSCAVHDVIHAIKRVSAVHPTAENPERRTRAVPCLYSLGLQSEWLRRACDPAIYCTPYIGWWDNTGDHLHPDVAFRDGFMDGKPYGVSAFTKMKLGVLPAPEVQAVATTTSDTTFDLVPLSKPDCASDKLRGAKIMLSQDEYLLVEFRRQTGWNADNLITQIPTLLGHVGEPNPFSVNPPVALVSDKGLLIYHVNEADSVRQAGCPVTVDENGSWPWRCPDIRDSGPLTQNSEFVTNFVMFLYTPSMGDTVDYPAWSATTQRTPADLKDAAFYINDPEFNLRWRGEHAVTIRLLQADDDRATVQVVRPTT